METLSLIALILLSLVGYSAGVSFSSKHFPDPKPSILDLILIVLIWAGAICAKLTFSVNRWLLILICAASAFLIAGLASSLTRRQSLDVKSESKESEDQSAETHSLWEKWKRFSKKMGGFQSRTILSLFYFTIVFPFAVVVKFLPDPLNLKRKNGTKSHWLIKKPLDFPNDSFRKQF